MKSEINSRKHNAGNYKPVKFPQSYLRSFIHEFKCTFSKQLQLNIWSFQVSGYCLLHGPMSCIANPYFVEGIKVPRTLVSKGKGKPRQ